MAEITGILGAIAVSAHTLNVFADQVKKWELLSDRLFDIQEGLDAAELSFDSWRRKYDIQGRRPVTYAHVLFGRLGWERIQQTLGSIKIVSKAISTEISLILQRATRARPGGAPQQQLDGKYDEQLVRECLQRIRKKVTWSRKFNYSVLGKADDLEIALKRLNRKLTRLERFSEHYLELEHPDIFHEIKRLPGRRVILKVGDSRMDAIQRKLIDALSARKDADLLHRASGQGNRVHIGLSVPQILKRDFAFLLSLNGQTHEVLIHPVKFKAINDRARVQSTIDTAVPALLSNALAPCYMLPPSAPLSAGFQLSKPPTNILTELEYRDPLSTLIKNQNNFLGQQVLYPQDQVAVACGIVQGCFRFLGSQWLQFLDCKNIRWRRSAESKWTSMMAAVPGDASTTRTFDRIIIEARERRDRRDLSKHCQIFRIGMLLTEIALKTLVWYIEYDSTTGGAKIYIKELGDEALDATEIASEVELKTNLLMGHIVFFCLSALQERDMMSNKEIEADYYKDVLRQADELEAFVTPGKRRGSPIGTPNRHGPSTPL